MSGRETAQGCWASRKFWRERVNTVESITEFLNELAPLSLSEDWDNTGLLVGERQKSVSRVMTCLTVIEGVVDEAVREGVDLIVSHHPMMFRGVQSITDETAEGRMLLKLIASGVAIYSPHTAFDSCLTGINQQLAESFGVQEIQGLRKSEAVGHPGSGRWGALRVELPFRDFLERVRSAVDADYLEFCGDSAAMVGAVAVACGSAAEFLGDAIQCGCDVFVTGEARFHSALEAQAAGINLVLMGHYESERPAVEWLAEEIRSRVPDVEVTASKMDQNPLQLFVHDGRAES